MSIELNEIKASKIVDARGVSCPGPLMAVKRGLTEVPANGILEVISSDEGTKRDIPLWCKKMGHEYLGCKEEPGYSRIFVQRKE